MTDAEKPRRPLRRNRSIYQVHYGLPREADMARPLPTPSDDLELREYEKQVAGHKGSCDQRYLGLLQCNNGTVLKPLLKPSQRREVLFYEQLAAAEDPDLVEFRGYVPKYYGCRKFTYNGCEQEYIVLEDVVEGMAEPCIMDVKVGRQTWDHLATAEKIERERSKYPCREQLGFCIPGYQVYQRGGRLLRCGKDHGKRLQGPAVKDALRVFLNGGACRALLLALLTPLWRLRRWAARQRALRPAACSLLLAYDAAGLAAEAAPAAARGAPAPRLSAPWSAALDRLDASHSFEHDYEAKLTEIRGNYRAALEQLSGAPGAAWCAVRVIDFAHAHLLAPPAPAPPAPPAPAPAADFAAGLGGLIAILEELLAETDDQTV